MDGIYRRDRRQGKQFVMLSLSALCLFSLTMFAVGLYTHHRKLTQLAQEGKRVTVQVDARSQDIFGRYYLEYDAPDMRIGGMDIVSEEAYRNTPCCIDRGATYLPADPHIIHLGTVTPENVAADLHFLLRAISCLTLVVASVLWAVWRFYAREGKGSSRSCSR